jgi:hypothetical protein
VLKKGKNAPLVSYRLGSTLKLFEKGKDKEGNNRIYNMNSVIINKKLFELWVLLWPWARLPWVWIAALYFIMVDQRDSSPPLGEPKSYQKTSHNEEILAYHTPAVARICGKLISTIVSIGWALLIKV